MNSSLRFVSSQLNPTKYFKDNKLINVKFISDNIESKMNLIDFVLQKFQIKKTYEKLITPNHVNSIMSPHIMDASLTKLNETKKSALQQQLNSIGVDMVDSPSIKVPWFPTKFSDLDFIGKTLFEEQIHFNQDHPQFTDIVYRKRRDYIASIAMNYKMSEEIPTIDYTSEQHQLWRFILKGLRPLHRKHFCQRFQHQLQQLNAEFNIENKIPQLAQLSQYLQEKSGWRIKPVQGIISQRQFLNALAFKIFLSTQYLRHPITPHYTPEPDIVHEFLGHIPMFADEVISQLSQKIGLISLGASDQEIKKLGAIYFFTIQFGVCKQNGEHKAYGAGFASCIKEIEHLINPQMKFKKFEPKIDCVNKFSTQQLQPVYYVTDSFEEAVKEVQQYGDQVQKPFQTWFNEKTKTIEYNRSIQSIIH